MLFLAKKSRTKRFCFHHHICAIRYIITFFFREETNEHQKNSIFAALFLFNDNLFMIIMKWK